MRNGSGAVDRRANASILGHWNTYPNGNGLQHINESHGLRWPYRDEHESQGEEAMLGYEKYTHLATEGGDLE